MDVILAISTNIGRIIIQMHHNECRVSQKVPHHFDFYQELFWDTLYLGVIHQILSTGVSKSGMDERRQFPHCYTRVLGNQISPCIDFQIYSLCIDQPDLITLSQARILINPGFSSHSLWGATS